MANAGAAAGAAFGALQANAPPGARPTVRNPMMVLLLTLGLVVGGQIIGAILGAIVSILALVGSLIALGGMVMFIVYGMGMLRELGNYTQDQNFAWWWMFIPCLNIYFFWFKVPEQVTMAKQKAGILMAKPTRGIVLYIFLFPFALANDLNDIAQG